MPKLSGTLSGREQIAAGTWAFHFALPGGLFAYKPGQTIDVTIPNPTHQDSEGNKRTFSIAVAPGAETLLIATRVRGSAFKRNLVEGKIGMPLEIEGPFGSFTLPNKPGAFVFLAGGIGITPFRAMAEDAIDRRLTHSLFLIHSNRAPEEAPFLKELQGWSAANPSFRYLPTMTDVDPSRWTGERRRIGPELLAEVLPADRNEPIYYIAGPDGFVKGMAEALKGIGVDEDRVRSEEFPGY